MSKIWMMNKRGSRDFFYHIMFYSSKPMLDFSIKTKYFLCDEFDEI